MLVLMKMALMQGNRRAVLALVTTILGNMFYVIQEEVVILDLATVQFVHFRHNYSSGLVVGGIYGSNTKKASTKAYQTILGVTAYGIFGADSKAAVKTLREGSRGHDVRIMQGMLYCRGVASRGVDGIYSTGTYSAVKRFHESNGLAVDGIAGKDTMYVLYN